MAVSWNGPNGGALTAGISASLVLGAGTSWYSPGGQAVIVDACGGKSERQAVDLNAC